MRELIAIFAVGVGVLYAYIAIYLIPRLAQLAERDNRVGRSAQYGAAAFFLGCAVTHWSIAVHTVIDDVDPANHAMTHLLPHVAQLVGGGVFAYAALTTLDVKVRTKREALEASEAAAQRVEAERRHRLEGLGQLAGGIAHDFNNLLTVILTYSTETAQQLSDRPVLQQQIREVIDAASRGSDLTRQLLSFSHGQRPEATPIDVDATIRGTQMMLQTAVGDAVSVTCELDAPGVTAQLGRGDLEQVLLNLAVNARNAMPEGGKLQISTQAHEVGEERLALRISVADEGAGMSPEVAERAFEPFYTTRGIEEGTGLGLSVVHGIVQRAGGTISLQSELGSGTRFDIDLPAQAAPSGGSRPAALVVA